MKKALIIQNKYVGDVLVASTLAKNLHKIFPDISVDILCYNKAIGVVENNPYLRKIISFDDNELKKIPNLLKLSRDINKEKYDIILDPYAKLQSRFITFRSRAKYKISYDKPLFKHIYTHTVQEYEEPKYSFCTSLDDRIKLLTPFQPNFATLDYQTDIFLREAEIAKAKEELLANKVDFKKPILIFGVLGSEEDKSLPLEYMATLVNHFIATTDATILFNYVPNQQPQVDEILKYIPKREQIITNVLGKNVREFASILYHADAIIANEGGAINMAKAMKKPTFSIFSPHKFRRDWGCYENTEKHQSFHLEDIYPEVYKVVDFYELLKKPKPYYQLMSPHYIIPKIEKFLTENNIQVAKNTLYYPKNDISAVLITKNEEKNIEIFLQDFSFVEELIVVDSFSNDNTPTIVEKNPKVHFYQRTFDNFAFQKNFALQKATQKWIIFFDADERLNENLKVEILKTIYSNCTCDAYFIKRKFYFQEKPMHFSGWQNDKAIRLLKNGKGKYGENRKVHEIMQIDGSIGCLKNKLDHYSLERLDSYVQKLDLYAKLKANELYENGMVPNFFHLNIKPIFRFLHHYIFRLGIFDGKNGYTIATIYSAYVKKRYSYLKLYISRAKNRKN